uniref:Uncharacterized protein n=1 Tax=Cacopsylla melanoneura TaxID=428564 RepID=A0A8D9ANR4_9HEMI
MSERIYSGKYAVVDFIPVETKSSIQVDDGEFSRNRPEDHNDTDHHQNDRHIPVGSVSKLTVMEQTAKRSLDVFTVEEIPEERRESITKTILRRFFYSDNLP